MAESTSNARNQLDQTVIESGLFTVECSSDALGCRVARVTRGGGVTSTTWFFTNGWNVERTHHGSAE